MAAFLLFGPTFPPSVRSSVRHCQSSSNSMKKWKITCKDFRSPFVTARHIFPRTYACIGLDYGVPTTAKKLWGIQNEVQASGPRWIGDTEGGGAREGRKRNGRRENKSGQVSIVSSDRGKEKNGPSFFFYSRLLWEGGKRNVHAGRIRKTRTKFFRERKVEYKWALVLRNASLMETEGGQVSIRMQGVGRGGRSAKYRKCVFSLYSISFACATSFGWREGKELFWAPYPLPFLSFFSLAGR